MNPPVLSASSDGPFWFRTATQAILKNWTALQLIVAHQSAGPDTPAKAEWLATAIPQWFAENPDLTLDEVAGFLEDLIVDEFHVQIDDGSYEEVGAMLLKYQRICHTLPAQQVQVELRQLPRCDLARSRVEDPGLDPSEPGSAPVAMETSSSTPSNIALTRMTMDEAEEPVTSAPMDPDAWITVAPKKKGRAVKSGPPLS
ncbi:hypothetical protein TCAL_17329 [Tigriopus californicus]|uniref:Pre-rRNA-processing protein TSR2 homolog n=1 Tax=Tigriopus californicus TaxID=6832 RepID=A0A553P0I5_TIGCA|nr:pre-rRNA-processing protein TSR2 homolog [Tigriopus californicus]TRY71190.1 hypothetical protein TCAL_17329 [Tigriopus californicus]